MYRHQLHQTPLQVTSEMRDKAKKKRVQKTTPINEEFMDLHWLYVNTRETRLLLLEVAVVKDKGDGEQTAGQTIITGTLRVRGRGNNAIRCILSFKKSNKKNP
jgi:hypothetical protein